MSELGIQQVNTLQKNIECLVCCYNLRGLKGKVVTCPECGTQYDIAKLMTKEWTGSMFNVPGYNMIITPVIWLAILGFPILAIPLSAISSRDLPLPVLFFPVLVVIAWSIQILRLRALMPDDRAVYLSLLAHLLFFGYLTGTIGIIVMIVGTGYSDPVTSSLQILMTLPLFLMLYYCRRGEKYIATHCLRHYLKEQN